MAQTNAVDCRQYYSTLSQEEESGEVTRKSFFAKFRVTLDYLKEDEAPPVKIQHKIVLAVIMILVIGAAGLCIARAAGFDSEAQLGLLSARAVPAMTAFAAVLVAYTALLLMGAWAPCKVTSTMAAIKISHEKIMILAFIFLLPVILLYLDVGLDVGVLQKFRLHGDMGYFALNLSGICGGLLCAGAFAMQSSEGSRAYRTAIFAGAATQMLPAICVARALYYFVICNDASRKSDSYNQRLQDLGIRALLAACLAGEGLGEAIVTGLVQLYSIVHSVTLFNDYVILASVVVGVCSLSKTFAGIDVRGHVSRYLGKQPIVVGVARGSSAAFVAVAMYRLAAVSSRMLVLALFQQALHEDVQIMNRACAAMVLWVPDLLIQAALIWQATRNPWKLAYSLPNTISAAEPVLLCGGPYLTASPLHVALVHNAEAAIAFGVVLLRKSPENVFAALHHPRLLLGVLVGGIALQWLLWLLIRCIFALALDPAMLTPTIASSLEETALKDGAQADAADMRMPLFVVMCAANVKIDPHACSPQNIIEAMNTHIAVGTLQRQGCEALRIATFASADSKVRIAELGGIEAALRAMKQHESSAAVQERACGALQNLSSNASNKIRIARAELGGIELVLQAMKQHESSAEVQELGGTALFNLSVGCNGNKIRIKELGGIEVVEQAMKQHASSAAVQQSGGRLLHSIVQRSLQLEGQAEEVEEFEDAADFAPDCAPDAEGDFVMDLF